MCTHVTWPSHIYQQNTKIEKTSAAPWPITLVSLKWCPECRSPLKSKQQVSSVILKDEWNQFSLKQIAFVDVLSSPSLKCHPLKAASTWSVAEWNITHTTGRTKYQHCKRLHQHLAWPRFHWILTSVHCSSVWQFIINWIITNVTRPTGQDSSWILVNNILFLVYNCVDLSLNTDLLNGFNSINNSILTLNSNSSNLKSSQWLEKQMPGS